MADKRPNIFISSLARSLPTGGSDTEIYLSTITTLDGQAVTTEDFSFFGKGVISVDVQSSANAEFCSFTGLSQINTSLTGCIRGLSFKDFTEISANKKFHPVGTPVILSFGTHDIIQLQTIIEDNYDTLFALIESATIQGGVPASTTAMGISRLSASPNVTLGTATITIASPAVITKSGHGLTVNDIVQFTTTGSLPTGISVGVSYYVLSTGLTANDFQISLIPNGTAINTTGSQSGVHTLIKSTPIAQKALDTDTLAAFGGTSGTPSETNPFVTQNDTTNGANKTATTIAFVNSNPDTITDSGNGFLTAGFQEGQTITVTGSVSNNNTFTIATVSAGTITLVAGDSLVAESAGASVTIRAAVIGKLIRTDSTGSIPSEIIEDSGLVTDNNPFTASGDIDQYDYVYSNGTNTVKTVQPTSVLSQSSPSTSFTGLELTKAFKYSATQQVYFTGGDDNDNQELNVYIGTVNSAGTDVSFSAKTTLQALTFNFSVCELSLGHYIVIFQDSNAGVADGIKVLSVTYDGTTVTVGSATTLETTGSTSIFPACSTLDASRALLVYRRDSDKFIVGQVISVSGNTISTNTVGVIKSTAGAWKISAVNLDTDKTFISYDTNGTTTVRGAVVSTSGTSITATGTEASISSSSDWSYAPAFRITTNKVFVMYREQSSSTFKYQTNIITNSGTTLTVGAQTVAPNDNGVNGVNQYGSYVSLNDDLQLGLFVNGWTQASPDAYKVHILNMSGTTLSVVSSSNTFTCASAVLCLVKLQPFIYGSYGSSCKQIINLKNPTETRLGVAMNDIANTTSGNISLPYRIVSGFVGLTPATLYYTDDNGTYTTESSTYTREYGVAINSTTMLLK